MQRYTLRSRSQTVTVKFLIGNQRLRYAKKKIVYADNKMIARIEYLAFVPGTKHW